MGLNESSVYQLLGWVPPDKYLLPGGDTVEVSQAGPACVQAKFATGGDAFEHTEVVDFFPEFEPVVVAIWEEKNGIPRVVPGADHAIFHPRSSRFERLLADLVGAAIDPKTRSVW
jgi:hypothetical protein